MDFAKFFVDRPIFAAVLSLVIFISGLIALPLLPISEYPEVVPPSVVVRTVYPGANPKVIAETVATPLEEAINGVEDMMYIKSVAGSDGVLQVTATFRPGTDADDAAVTNLAIFTEHNPSEFEIVGGHYLTVTPSGESGSGAAATDVEPVGNALAAAEPECPSPPASPPKDDDNPCFSETATACRLDDASLAPAAAYAQCFGAADGGAAARVSMRALKAGDVVLASPTETTRVIVNQHAAVRLSSAAN